MAEPKAKSLQQKLGFFDDDLKSPDHDTILLWVDKNIDKIISSIYNFKEWNAKEVEALKVKALDIAKKEYERENEELLKKETSLKYEEKQKYDAEKQLEEEIEKDKKIENAEIQSYNSVEWTKRRISETDKKIIELKEEIEKSIRKLKYLEEFDGLPEELPVRKQPHVIQKKWEYTVTSESYNSKTGYQSSKSVIGFIDMRVDFVYSRLIIDGLDIENKRIRQKLQWSQTEKKYDTESDLLTRKMLIEVKTKITSLGELFRQLNTYREYASGDYIVICPDDSNKEIIENQGFMFYKYEKKE